MSSISSRSRAARTIQRGFRRQRRYWAAVRIQNAWFNHRLRRIRGYRRRMRDSLYRTTINRVVRAFPGGRRGLR